MSPTGLKQERQVLVLVLVLAVFILWVYYALMFQPLLKRVSGLGTQVKTSALQLQQTQEAIAKEGPARQEHDRLRTKLDELHTHFPPEEALPSVIKTLSDLATQSGVKIQTIFPQRGENPLELLKKDKPAPNAASKAPDLYTEIPIQLDAVAGFHELGMFLSRVESGAQPMQLRSLRVQANSSEIKRHDVKIVIAVYFLATPSSKP